MRYVFLNLYIVLWKRIKRKQISGNPNGLLGRPGRLPRPRGVRVRPHVTARPRTSARPTHACGSRSVLGPVGYGPTVGETETGERPWPAIARRRWPLQWSRALLRTLHVTPQLDIPFPQPLPHRSTVADGDGGQRRWVDGGDRRKGHRTGS
jgi:hypothetical protein